VRRSPALAVYAALVLILVVVTVLVAAPATAGLPELSVRSSASNGGRALWLWLEALGYRVEELDQDPYRVDE
jgi:hypothetical protein